MSVTDWSPLPAANATADPTVPAMDGASQRAVPGLVRGVMAKAAALALDQGGALVTGGTENAYTLTTNSGVTKIRPGVSLSFWADRDNTGAPTLNVDGAGPRVWLDASGLALPAGSIQAGLLYTVAWSEALPGSRPAWRMVGAASGIGGSVGLPAGVDFSGPLSERALYDAQPKGKTFLAIAEAPSGPVWTLFIKRSNANADWSVGLPIKASPAQSTLDAQAAADAAKLSAGTATAQAASAGTARAGSETARAGSEIARDAAAVQVGLAASQADRSAASASEARFLAGQVGALLYDMGTLDQPSDGSTTFDFGAL